MATGFEVSILTSWRESLAACPVPVRQGAETDLEFDLDIPLTLTCGFINVAALGKSKS